MTYIEQILDTLRADTTLMAILTGGAHLFEDPGPKGINRVQIKAAFNQQTGLIKPIAIISGIQESPTGEAIDATTNFMSTETPVYIWVYDAGQRGYEDIASACDRIYTLLNNMRLTGGFQVLWKTTLKNRQEPLLNDARYYAIQYNAYGFKT